MDKELEKTKAWLVKKLTALGVRTHEYKCIGYNKHVVTKLEFGRTSYDDTPSGFVYGDDEEMVSFDPGYYEDDLRSCNEKELWEKQLLEFMKHRQQLMYETCEKVSEGYWKHNNRYVRIFACDISDCNSWEEVMLKEAVANGQ